MTAMGEQMGILFAVMNDFDETGIDRRTRCPSTSMLKILD